MKLLLLLSLGLGFSISSFAQGSIKVKVSGIDTKKGGHLSVGLFLKENFPKPHKHFQEKWDAIKTDGQWVEFPQVPAGTYGVVAFQDLVSDKDLKTNWVGLPKEPIGFSNGAKIKLGPPAFEDAAIAVENGKVTSINIKLSE